MFWGTADGTAVPQRSQPTTERVLYATLFEEHDVRVIGPVSGRAGTSCSFMWGGGDGRGEWHNGLAVTGVETSKCGKYVRVRQPFCVVFEVVRA